MVVRTNTSAPSITRLTGASRRTAAEGTDDTPGASDSSTSAVGEPKFAHRDTTLVSLGDYLAKARAKGDVVGTEEPQLFAATAQGVLRPTGRDAIQGDLGDCYWASAFSALAMYDPAVLQQHVRPAGKLPNGDTL